ncbi:MAG TPA: HD domain-containing protein [Phaeodactylibacter sp.]|nr:HD domain-containing protein [Phaeodactylibacter sp.]
MKDSLPQVSVVERLLRPETTIENNLIQHPDFKAGLFWGKPRYGHPEGKVIYHIAEVLKNIDQLQINSHTRQQLRLVTFLHDTFKYKEDQNRPRDWSKHHGVLARQFAEKFIDDKTVLSIIEYHDEAFYSWRSQYVFNQKEKGEARMKNLLQKVEDHLQTFYLFFKCDTQTGDKTPKPIIWFEETVKNIQPIQL